MQLKNIFKTSVLIIMMAVSFIHVQPVFAGPSAPAIVSINAVNGNGYYKDGDTVAIAVHFSQAVDVTNSPFLGLNTGGTANYASGSGTDTLVFNYGVWFGPNVDHLNVNYVSLNGTGTIIDTATNTVNADLTIPNGQNLSDDNTVVIDNTAPTITSASITGLHQVTVTFSENVLNNFSGEYSNFSGALATRTITGQAGNTGTNTIVLTFDGASLLDNGKGIMDVSTNIIDYAGNHFAGVTGLQVTPLVLPAITSAVYRDADSSGTVSGGDTVTFTFKNDMNTSTVDVSNVDARIKLNNGHTFGTTGLAVDWPTSKTLVVTLGSDTTLANNDTVTANDQVTDTLGVYDFNNTQVSITTDGWYAQYWNWGSGTSPDLTGMPTTPDAIQNVSSSGYDLNTDWGFGSPDSLINNDNFVGIFSKTSYFDSGYYNVSMDSDDGILVKIDGGKIMLAWQDVYGGNVPVFLSAGYHTFQIYYYENVGGAHLHVNVHRVPILGDASINGSVLTMNYDQSLNTGSVPDISDYQVKVNGKSVTVSKVTVGGTNNLQVILNLANPVSSTDVITISYSLGAYVLTSANNVSVFELVDQPVQNATVAITGGSSSGQGKSWAPIKVISNVKSPYTFIHTLKKGMKGDDVVVLQNFLHVTPVASKNFGLKTKAALIAYQKSHGLTADGILGPKSRVMIEGELNK